MIEEFRPEEFGLVNLPIPVAPNLETALGYPGNERYFAFHECRVSTPGFFIEDADQQWPGVEAGWALFCRHPAVAKVLEALRLDLKRTVPVMTWGEWIALSDSQREEYWSRTRYLVLDRQDRVLYVGIHPKVRMFLITEPASREPEADDDDEIIDEEFDLKVQSAARDDASILDEEPKLDATVPVEISRAVLGHLRSWLDEHEPVDDDYSPGAAESCGFRRTNIRVEPGQIEDTFGYRGGKRYISLHWSPKVNQVFVCDGIGRRSFSEAVDTWTKFLNHPLVRPHLQVSDESETEWRVAPIDFSAQIDKVPESPLFSSERSAREMEADVRTNCLLYDRAGNEIYSGRWASALLFHSLVEDVLEEDLVPDLCPAAVPLLIWLDERQEDPEYVFAVAASYHQHHKEQDALAMLRHCIDRDPTSHVYWCRLSQALGSLSQWEDALEACEKAVAFHVSSPRQYVSAGYMLKWKAQCLFMLQRYSEAADTYRFVIEIDDFAHKADSYSQLARCYEWMGAYHEAIGARELQVRDRTDSLSATLRCRESEYVADEMVDTERFFLGEAWFDLGRSYVLDGNVGAAEWALRRAFEVVGEFTRARAELGALLLRLGRVEEAEAQIQDALTLARLKIQKNPQLGSAHSDLAFVYRAMGNCSAAEQADQRAAELGWKSSDEERRIVSMEAAGLSSQQPPASLRQDQAGGAG
jgi:tetratricopeptide (TPR) repeat protein